MEPKNVIDARADQFGHQAFDVLCGKRDQFCRSAALMRKNVVPFPKCKHVYCVERLTYGCVERLDILSDAKAFMDSEFCRIAKQLKSQGFDDDTVTSELRDLLCAVARTADRLFEVDVSAVQVDVLPIETRLIYERQNRYAG